MTDTSSQWKEWNAEGLIPGPDETEEEYNARVAFCHSLSKDLEKRIGAELPFETYDDHSRRLLHKSFPLTDKLYGIHPQWVPLFFSNHHLTPWHGGCAWIFQLDEHTPTSAFLQLRAELRHSPTYWKIYDRKELIAHELAHVGRMAYEEPIFEEMLAYQTSSMRWRRWFGPIFQSSRETLLFILIMGIVFLADFALLTTSFASAATIAWWLKIIPFALIGLALGRLAHRHKLFQQCRQNLEALYPLEQVPHLQYRLSDQEIQQFAILSPGAIRDFIHHQMTFRWQFLKQIYPLK